MEKGSKGKEKESDRIISIPKGKREFDAGLFGATIQKGFARLHKDEQTSDIILLVGTEKIPTHRMVLCAWSDTFRGMLETGSWEESNQKELKINIEEEDYGNFKLLVEYMYTGNTDFVDDDNVIPLISLTNYYGIHSLKEVCGRLLGEQIDDGNIQFLLDLVDKYDCKELEKKCGEFLASNFEELWDHDQKMILSLRPDTWAAMLQSDDLAVSSEQLLFEIIQQYVARFEGSSEDSKENVLNRLLPHIRYSFISTKYLTEDVERIEALMSHPLMQKILFENYRYKAYIKCVPTIFSVKVRTGFQKFDDQHKGPNITLSNESTTASFAAGGWQTARTQIPFSESYVYCEFKCETVTNLMIGAMVGNVSTTGYVGQHVNGCSIHNSDGSLYYGGASNQTNVTWFSGDTIGVSYIPSTGKLSWYKGGTKFYTHTIQQDCDNVYATISVTSTNSVSLVPRPVVPDDLVEFTRSKRRQAKKEEEEAKKATIPPPTPGTPFTFGGGFGTTPATAGGLFGTTTPTAAWGGGFGAGGLFGGGF